MTAPCFSRRILQRCLAEPPGRLAVRGVSAELSYGRVLQVLVSFANELRRRGVGPNSVLLIDIEPGTWFFNMLLRLAISLNGAKWIFYGEKLLQFGPVTHLLSTNPAFASKHRNFILFEPSWFNLSLEEARKAAPQFPGLKPDDAFCWMSTSATTGEAKLLQYTAAEIEGYIARDPFPGRSLSSLFGHESERAFWPLMNALLDGKLIIDEPDPRIETRRPECLTGSPQQVADWMAKIGPPPVGVPRLQCLYPIGAAISREQVASWLAYFELIRSPYAGTEMGVVGDFIASEPLKHEFADYAPLPDLQVEVVDARGTPLPPLQEGEVRVRTPRLDWLSTSNNYYSPDGWFYPGDQGFLTQEGRLVILGRIGDVLNIGGVKFNANQLAEGLQQASLVAFAIGYEKRTADGTALLAVLADPGARTDLAELAQEMRSYAAKLRFPKIGLVQFSSSRPVNANGKASRRLAAGIAQGLPAY